ncbi:Uncharacterised protein [Serratia quinivorans]|uniref:hypothetical protein n=1 Tax=Serratia quinivorans TaxID=137545 RepID=UPI00217B14A5|nr:hypothetical protein [Serratia quinivorans]CAI0713372.1 Uncharacterised protein [Serratia quinivorans]
MAKKQYGIMPPFPKLVAMMRSSDSRHFVYGIDWLTKAITIHRNGAYEIVPIEMVRFVEPTEEEFELLNRS